VRLPSPCVVVLVGPSGSGKSAWAAEWFRPDQVVSSDRLRALVGEGEHDQRAGTDAFDVLDLVVERRSRRRLLTVIDTLGLDDARRRSYLAAAHAHGLPCHAVAFDVAPADCRARNKVRPDHQVPGPVLTAQLKAWAGLRPRLAEDGFDGLHAPGPVRLVPPELLDSPAAAARQREDPMTLRFGLHLSSFPAPGGAPALGPWLAATARTAEQVGFSTLTVMDHMIQIPQVGREWDDMLESTTALGFLAAATESARLGVLVHGVTYRNVAHLGKLTATLDVLSGGRALCGIGAAWFEHEHRAYGWEFPGLSRRFDLLEDALRLLPVLWGPGSPPFVGKAVSVPEAICYPRPLQAHLPILVGGSGERRTLRLVAELADACNLFGDADAVRHKVEVLHRHCAEAGRDPAEVEVTSLTTALAGSDAEEVDGLLDRLRPRHAGPHAFATSVTAGTVEDHIGRYRRLAEAGVQTAMVSLADLALPGAVERFAPVVAAFR
jgi:F420-dependent oxidoreductase-like protein